MAIVDARPLLDDITHGIVQTVLEGFADLVTCRPIGMVVGPIPWTAIRAWALDPDRGDLDDEARAILVRSIRYLDDSEMAERAKKSKPPPPAPRGPVARAAQAAQRSG
jgi:hypothetical protein